jgi:hypothetical protein
MSLLIEGETKSIAGRKPNPIVYNELEDCVEGIIQFNEKSVKFFIDKEELEKVKTRNWHLVTNGKYVGANIRINGNIKILYLHNFVMQKFDFPGKGTKQSIDHINRNGLDNRKSNLRLATQTEQNLNQQKKPRHATLPDGITDLPKHIYYIKANGNHGDGFAVEFKKDKKRIYYERVRSKVLTIQEKLVKIKELLEIGYTQFPDYRPT